MELTPDYEQVIPETQKVPEVVTDTDPDPELNTDSKETVPIAGVPYTIIQVPFYNYGKTTYGITTVF
ncbi:hypothetical protein CEXT_235731 [Caerostris extrusa]|uniref:Uncharacterized protein n=1 Tax=Caerostris extrusa TaxID=172846 RepID=A0AAV4N6S6_CAEEX|nr:hypothetical protein CEXT_235731 [Caerostris extrusa]